ncbi:hypothetical protein [Alkaliflexus imshenetskii]|uniref:hypothetical protein n=1 Tax=Alkaliflexus imshenetskii TaxID=286730 RepID=UPI00047E0A26|nr:hypothetical protein [Alkaliflexus imshenetskii]
MDVNKKIQSFWFLVLFLILIIGGILRYCIFKRPYKELYSVKEYCLKEKDTSFSGRIINTYFDKTNKGAFVFSFKEKEDTLKHSIYLIVLHPESYIQEGDSIVKIKGESKYNIYKDSNPDSLVILDFDCSFWDKK